MPEVRIYKTSERLIVWMKRKNYTQQYIAEKLGISRQTFAKHIEDNMFSVGEIIVLKSLGFEG